MKTPKLTPDEMWVIVDALEDKKNILEIDKLYEESYAIDRLLAKLPDVYEIILVMAGKER